MPVLPVSSAPGVTVASSPIAALALAEAFWRAARTEGSTAVGGGGVGATTGAATGAAGAAPPMQPMNIIAVEHIVNVSTTYSLSFGSPSD